MASMRAQESQQQNPSVIIKALGFAMVDVKRLKEDDVIACAPYLEYRNDNRYPFNLSEDGKSFLAQFDMIEAVSGRGCCLYRQLSHEAVPGYMDDDNYEFLSNTQKTKHDERIRKWYKAQIDEIVLESLQLLESFRKEASDVTGLSKLDRLLVGWTPAHNTDWSFGKFRTLEEIVGKPEVKPDVAKEATVKIVNEAVTSAMDERDKATALAVEKQEKQDREHAIEDARVEAQRVTDDAAILKEQKEEAQRVTDSIAKDEKTREDARVASQLQHDQMIAEQDKEEGRVTKDKAKVRGVGRPKKKS